MAGFLPAVLYVIIREVRMPLEPKNTPVTILKERFAQGLITAEEFEKGKEILMKQSGCRAQKIVFLYQILFS
jgi:uncharacterized membrane protein